MDRPDEQGWVQRWARSGGVLLSVRERPTSDAASDAAAPTVVLVHGYPDDQTVWDPVARLLADQHGLRVVTYDVRGAGASGRPRGRAAYRSEHLVDDLVAVLDLVSPTAPVHLVGHDWGSVQLWDAVCTEHLDPRLTGRLASFTSSGGPSLDHVGYALRLARSRGDTALLRSQARRSWYVAAFSVPVLPELVWRRAAGRVRDRLAQLEGVDQGHWGDALAEDAVHGLGLYRANVRDRFRHPRPATTRVPVQLIVAELDPFLHRRLYDVVGDHVSDLTRVDVRAGHWVVRSQPHLVAGLVADQVRRHG